jgi:hypothetical protein
VSHRINDLISLEIGRRLAAELAVRPEYFAHAGATLAEWKRRNAGASGLQRCYAEWQEILDKRDVEEIGRILTTDDDESARLRGNAPFAGLIPPAELWELKRRVREAYARGEMR